MKRFFLSLVVALAFAAPASAQYPYRSHFPTASEGFYKGLYGNGHSTYLITGGYRTPRGYQPYSMTVTPFNGGAMYQGYGLMGGPGFFSGYSSGGFAPRYGYGYGFGMY